MYSLQINRLDTAMFLLFTLNISNSGLQLYKKRYSDTGALLCFTVLFYRTLPGNASVLFMWLKTILFRYLTFVPHWTKANGN